MLKSFLYIYFIVQFVFYPEIGIISISSFQISSKERVQLFRGVKKTDEFALYLCCSKWYLKSQTVKNANNRLSALLFRGKR